MIDAHESFTWPANREVQIWRYINFAKFASMLLTRSLFFARATLLGDPFEGSVPIANTHLLEESLKRRASDPGFQFMNELSDTVLRTLSGQMSHHRQQTVSQFLVNCWYMSEYESAAMWRLYAQADEAICVQSTFNRLANALPRYAFAGIVKYLDYKTDTIPTGNFLNPIVVKRKSYDHERELRAVIWEPVGSEMGGDEVRAKLTPGGLAVPVDLPNLIEFIYVNSTSPLWFKHAVEKLALLQGLTVEVKQSSLSDGCRVLLSLLCASDWMPCICNRISSSEASRL